MKRVSFSLEALANRDNLALALHKAAMGKRHRPEVALFLQAVDTRLNQLAADILAARMPYGRYHTFQIYDPKKRLIHAACFEDRVFHHAVMNLAGPVLEHAIRLSRRRKRSYQERRQFWEQHYQDDVIDAAQLQTGYAAVHAITQGADSLGWRRENLRRHPPLTV